MKIQWTRDADGVTIRLRGSIDSAQCDCLLHFFERHVDGTESRLRLDMTDVVDCDAESLAVLGNVVRQSLEGGTPVEMMAPPQNLAHLAYKARWLAHPKFTLVDPRTEEPYAG